MRIIKNLAAQMCEELEGSKNYAIEALECRRTRPELARLYHEMSLTEFQHANSLHDWAVRMVEEAKTSGETPPSEMLEKWETAHRLSLAQMVETKVFIDLYK